MLKGGKVSKNTKKIKNGKDLADAFRSDDMINKDVLNDPEKLKIIEKALKGTIYEIKE